MKKLLPFLTSQKMRWVFVLLSFGLHVRAFSILGIPYSNGVLLDRTVIALLSLIPLILFSATNTQLFVNLWIAILPGPAVLLYSAFSMFLEKGFLGFQLFRMLTDVGVYVGVVILATASVWYYLFAALLLRLFIRWVKSP